MSIQKAKSSVHVTIATTPLLSSGGARSSPPKGGTAYRGTVAPSTGYPIFLQLSMPPPEFAVVAASGRLVRSAFKRAYSRSDRPISRLTGPDAPAYAPRRLRCHLRFLSPAQGPGFVVAPLGAKAPKENKIWGGEPTRLCPFYFPHHLYNKVRYQNLALDFLFLSFIIERVFDYLGGAYE